MVDLKRRILLFAGLMGAWGVATGFAVYINVHEKVAGNADRFWVFLGGLLVAAIAAFIVETIRERIYPSVHGAQKISAARVLSTLVLLMALELVVSSWEQVAELFSKFQKAESPLMEASLLGTLGLDSGLGLQLFVFGMFWVVIGTAVSIVIARTSFGLDQADLPPQQRAQLSARKALVTAAALTALFLIGVRVVLTLYTLLTNPQCYSPGFEVQTGSYNVVENIPAAFGILLEQLAQWRPPLGGYVAVAVLVALALTAARATNDIVRLMTLAALIFCLLNTFFTDGDQFIRLIGAVIGTTLVWLVPVLVLSAAGPYLRSVGVEPRYWGFACFAAALILVLVTAVRVRFDEPIDRNTVAFILLAAAALVCGGLLFRGNASPRDFWPFAALAVGVGVACFTALMQTATFLNSFKASVLLSQDSLRREGTSVPIKALRFDKDADASALLKEASDLSGFTWFGGLEGRFEKKLMEVQVLRTRIARELEQREQRLIDGVCSPVGHPVIDAWIGDIVRAPGAPVRDAPPICTALREAQAGLCRDAEQDKSCRAETLAAFAARLDVSAAAPVDTRRWQRVLTNPPNDVSPMWLIERAREFLVVSSAHDAPARDKAGIRREIDDRLPEPWRGRNDEQIQQLALSPPSSLSDRDWAHVLLLWGLREPAPTEQVATQVVRRSPCMGGKCVVMLDELDFFRSRRLREIKLIASSIGRVEARSSTRTCGPREDYQGLERQHQLLSYVALRQADDRLSGIEHHLRPDEHKSDTSLLLELCLVGSIAFWVVAGLLAGWADLERRPGPGGRPSDTPN